MKFTIEKEAVTKVAQNASRGTTTRGSLPVLSNIFIKADKDSNTITAQGTDLDFSVTDSTTARVEKAGSCCVQGKLFAGILNAFEGGSVTIDVDENNLMTIKSGESVFNLQTISGTEFPNVPTYDPSNEFKMNIEKLVDGIRYALTATSSDLNRPVLRGVKFDAKSDGSLKLAATDSYKLAAVTLAGEGKKFTQGKSVVVPRAALEEIVKLDVKEKEEFLVVVTDSMIFFKLDTVILSVRLLDGNFPNYESLLKVDTKYRLVLDPSVVVPALKRIGLLGEGDTSMTVHANITDGFATLTSKKIDKGDVAEKVSVTFTPLEEQDGESVETGEDEEEVFTIGFNLAFLTSVLNIFGDATVTMEINSPVNAVAITGDSPDNLRYILMPVRV